MIFVVQESLCVLEIHAAAIAFRGRIEEWPNRRSPVRALRCTQSSCWIPYSNLHPCLYSHIHCICTTVCAVVCTHSCQYRQHLDPSYCLQRLATLLITHFGRVDSPKPSPRATGQAVHPTHCPFWKGGQPQTFS